MDIRRRLDTPHIKPVRMATRRSKTWVSLLDKIDILDRKTTEASPTAQQVFKVVSGILALVRVGALALRPSVNSHLRLDQDKMIADKDSVQFSDYCFKICEALEDPDDLNGHGRIELENLGRYVCWR